MSLGFFTTIWHLDRQVPDGHWFKILVLCLKMIKILFLTQIKYDGRTLYHQARKKIDENQHDDYGRLSQVLFISMTHATPYSLRKTNFFFERLALPSSFALFFSHRIGNVIISLRHHWGFLQCQYGPKLAAETAPWTMAFWLFALLLRSDFPLITLMYRSQRMATPQL